MRRRLDDGVLLRFGVHLTLIDNVSKLCLPQRKRERPIAPSVVFSRFHIKTAHPSRICLLTLQFIGRPRHALNKPTALPAHCSAALVDRPQMNGSIEEGHI